MKAYQIKIGINITTMYFAKILNGKQGYSKRQIHNAERVEAFVETIGNPSEKDSRTLVRTDGILKCPITIEDVDIYFKIYK